MNDPNYSLKSGCNFIKFILSYHSRVKLLIILLWFLGQSLSFGQVATEIIRTSDSASLVTVLNSGYMGIGTETPQQLLVVRGNETASGEQFQITSIAGARTWGIGVGSSGGLTIRDESGFTNPISISAGAATGSISVGSQSISLLTGGVSSHIRFSTNATEQMRLDVNGNLGIGTSSPTEKLEVTGTIKTNGFKMSSGAMNNYVLTSDGLGTASWQPAFLSGTSGTSNYISKFTSTTSLGNSAIYEDGSKIGIGTTTPQQLLVLRGDETGSGEQFQITSITGARTWGIGVGNSGGLTIRDETGLVNPISITPGAATGSLSIGSQSISLLTGGVSSHIKFSTNATEQMRLDVNGNLGIGTTAPSEKLDVSGTIKGSTLTITGGGQFANAVGIGTSPEGSSHLHVAGNVTLNTNNQLKFDGGAGTAMIRYNSTGNRTEFFCYPSSGFTFNQGGAELVRIKSDGNVGIGTTSPTEKLEVSGTLKATGLNISGTTVFSNPVGIATSPEGSSHLHVAGNVTLNTNNQLKLDGGAGTSMIRYNSTGNLTEFFCYPSAGFTFNQGGTELIRIKSDGNVGLGTATPAYKLDVSGGIRCNTPMIIGPGTDQVLWFNRNESFWTRARIGFYWDGSSNNLDLALIDGTSDIETARIQLKQDNSIVFRTSNAEVMRMDNAGNVGIGVSSPTNILTFPVGSLTDPIADAWPVYSSRRWKTNIHTIENALADILSLRGVTYQWKADGKPDIGFIAEELAQVLPEIVTYEENGIDARSVDYSRIIAVLVEAIKEQESTIRQQREELDSINSRLALLEKMMVLKE